MNPPSPNDLHADPAHWKLGIFYFCRQDPRILVPKRIQGLGWTINFARPAAYVWIVLLTVFSWGTVTLARAAGADAGMIMLVKVLLAAGILTFCYRAAQASTSRR